MSSGIDSATTVSRPSGEPPSNGQFHLQPGAEPVPGYRLVELLGRGGFGEVWKANGPGDIAVAMKFVPLNEAAGEVELRSLESMKDIRHPHLLAVFGTWQLHGHLILAMELADRTLMQRHRECVHQGLPGIPLHELLEYLREAAKGIDYLNSLGVQHRDIKPSNLFLLGGSVKVADFGLAKSLNESVGRHTGAMTPAYAPPEFFRGEIADASDQYSLAVSYCQLRTGQLPFGGGTAIEVMNNVLQNPPRLETVTEPERPVLAKALAKQPRERWPDCRAFAAALTEAAPAEDRLPPPMKPNIGSTNSQPAAAPLMNPTYAPTGLTTWPRRTLRKAVVPIAGILLLLGYAEWKFDFLGWRLPPALAETACLQKHTGEVTSVAFGLSGRLVSGSADRTVRLWDAGDYQRVRILGEHLARVNCVAIASDEKRVASGGNDNTVRVWDAEKGGQVWQIPHDKAVTGVAFSPDGAKLVSAGVDGKLRIFDAATAKEVVSAEGHNKYFWMGDEKISAIAFTLNGQRILAARSTTVVTWKMDKEMKPKFLHPGGVVLAQPITSVAASPDGQHFLIGQGNAVRHCSLENGEPSKHGGSHDDRVTGVAYTPGAGRAVSAGDDATIRLWNLKSGQELARYTGHSSFLSVAVSADGKWAAGGSVDGTIRVIRLPE